MPKGYINEENNYVVDEKTGEVFGVDKLSKVYYETIETLEIKKQGSKRREVYNQIKTEFGRFSWFTYRMSEMLELDIAEESLAKLMMISTYSNYNNQLVLDNQKAMDINSMSKILGISSKTTYNFYNEMVDSGIFVETSNGIYLNENVFGKGSVDSLPELSGDNRRTRIYHKGIRDLYNTVNSYGHKIIAMGFKLIPFANLDYNIICQNISEEVSTSIIPMEFDDVLNILGYSPSYWKKAKSLLSKIEVNGHPYIRYIVDKGKKPVMFINPYVFYAGNKWNEAKVLGVRHHEGPYTPEQEKMIATQRAKIQEQVAARKQRMLEHKQKKEEEKRIRAEKRAAKKTSSKGG